MFNGIINEFSAFVIDPDRERGLAFCAFLKRSGIGSLTHCSAPTVQEARDQIAAQKPGLIFLRQQSDVTLAVRELLQVRRYSAGIPVILISQPAQEAVSFDMLAEGAQDFVTEPVNDILLKKVVLLALRNSKTAEALRKSNERLELVSKATNDMVWDWDLLNNRVYRSPEGWDKVFGEGAGGSESRLSDSWWDRVHPDDREKSNLIIEAVMANPAQEFFEIECRVLRNSGEYAFVVDRGYVVRNGKGEVTRLIGATQNITERKVVEKRLEEERKERQNEITGAVIAAQEQERDAIGKELHDNINQILAATKLYIEYAITNDEKRESLLKTAKEFVESAVKEIRNLTKSLAPASIGAQGLKSSLEELARTMNRVSVFNIRCEINIEKEKAIPDGVKLTVFRIMQEALTNISRHAAAKQVQLDVSQTAGLLKVSLKDDGGGFNPNQKPRGLGLRNMRSRAELFDGEFQIISALGKGTELRLIFKLPIS